MGHLPVGDPCQVSLRRQQSLIIFHLTLRVFFSVFFFLVSLASAGGFLSFLSGYSVFIGPFAGIMIVDVCCPG